MFIVSNLSSNSTFFALIYEFSTKDRIRIVSGPNPNSLMGFAETLTQFARRKEFSAVRHLLQAEDLSKLDLDRIMKDLEES